MHQFGFILIFLVLISCNNEIGKEQEIIKGMENAVENNSSDIFIRPLIANYLNYCSDFSEDKMCPVYLYRSAVLYYRVNNYNEASANLETILREYPETEILEDTYLTLAMLNVKKLRNNNRAEALYNEYLIKYPEGKGRLAAEYFFRPDKEKLQDFIDNILREINALPRGQEASNGKLNALMFAYANFVKANPDAPLSASYCLQGAKLAMHLNLHLIAIQFLDKIYRDYKDFSEYPQSLLMLALEYDTNIKLYLRKGKYVSSPLNEHITAQTLQGIDVVAYGGKLYKEILDRYPNHEVAPSAKNGLLNLGKKTNKVVEEFVFIQDSLKRAKNTN